MAVGLLSVPTPCPRVGVPYIKTETENTVGKHTNKDSTGREKHVGDLNRQGKKSHKQGGYQSYFLKPSPLYITRPGKDGRRDRKIEKKRGLY